jgi:hypothetical protein
MKSNVVDTLVEHLQIAEIEYLPVRNVKSTAITTGAITCRTEFYLVNIYIFIKSLLTLYNQQQYDHARKSARCYNIAIPIFSVHLQKIYIIL